VVKTTDADLSKMTQKDWDTMKEIESIEQKTLSLLDTIKTGDIKAIHKHIEIDFLPTVQKHNTERNIANEVRDFIKNANGEFTNLDVDRELNIPDKRYRSKLLNLIEKEGKIEKVSGGHGRWRKVNKVRHLMKWWEATGQLSDIKLPLGIHEQCQIYGHTMIGVAGDGGVGKSAFCLNAATINYGIFGEKIDYILCAEMGPVRYHKRLEKGEVDTDEFRKYVDVFEYRGGYLYDMIRPDRLTIIDYITPNFDAIWKIGETLEKINDRIGEGVVVVAMQKKQGMDFGYGGDFTNMVPSVSIALNDGLAKITKAKEYDDEKVSDPKGKIMLFRIRKGFHFDTLDQWHHKSDMDNVPKTPDPWGIRRA